MTPDARDPRIDPRVAPPPASGSKNDGSKDNGSNDNGPNGTPVVLLDEKDREKRGGGRSFDARDAVRFNAPPGEDARCRGGLGFTGFHDGFSVQNLRSRKTAVNLPKP